MARTGAVVLSGAILAAGAFAAPVQALPGDLDPAFSGDGYQTLRVSPLFSPTGVAADGPRVTVAGNAATYDECHRDIGCFTDAQAVLARYRADGTLDPAFGQGGIADLPDGDGRTLSPGTMLVPEDGAFVRRDAATGANAADQHLVGVDAARDLEGVEWADLRVATAGDPCPRCGEGRLGLKLSGFGPFIGCSRYPD